MDKDAKGFTTYDLEQIYAAAWSVGASNLLGLANDLPIIVSKGRYEVQQLGLNSGDRKHIHPAVKLFMGQMGFLAGISLGPEPELAREVEQMIKDRKAQETTVIVPVE